MTTTEHTVSPLLDERAECVKHPHWYWFALPVTRMVEDWPTSPEERRLAKVAHRRALVTCVSCPIAAACLDHAMAHEDHGVWGGVTAWERLALGGRGTAMRNHRASDPDVALVDVRARFGSKFAPIAEVLSRYTKRDVA